MAIDFPASPTTGQTFTSGSVTYTWDGVKWTAVAAGGGATDKIEEGNTSAEVIDTGSDGRFVVTTEGAEALRVDSSQRVGIGTASPSGLLHIEGNTCQMHFTDTDDASSSRIYNSGATFAIDVDHLNAKASSVFAIRIDDSEKARIDGSGRLLVGTSSSSSESTAVLQGNSNTSLGGPVLWMQRGQDAASTASGDVLGRIRFANNASNIYAAIEAFADAAGGSNDYPGRLVFSTTADGASSPTEALRIDRNQDVCIGSANSRTSRVCIESVADVRYLLTLNDLRAGAVGANTCLQFMRESTQVGGISTTSTATAYNTSSDYRLKENVTPVTDGITRLQQLKPSRFNFIADPTKTVDGFIAHEAQAVVPEAVTGIKDAVDADGNPVYQGIDQSKLVPLLTAALQEAIGEIESLKARVAALESA